MWNATFRVDLNAENQIELQAILDALEEVTDRLTITEGYMSVKKRIINQPERPPMPLPVAGYGHARSIYTPRFDVEAFADDLIKKIEMVIENKDEAKPDAQG